MRISMTGAAIAALCGLALAGCGKSGDAAKTGDAPAATASGGGSVAGAPAGMPKPRVGKWKLTTSMAGMPQGIPAQEICITAEMVNDTEWSKSQLPKDMDCPVMTQRVEGGAIIAHSVCKVNGHTLTGDTRTFGDFRDSYTVETTSSVDPAPPGMPNPTKMTIKAERVGDC